MSADRFPSLREDLSAEPLHAEVQAALRRLVEAGHHPKDVVDAAFATVSGLSVDVSGIALTAAHLLQVGGQLAGACPEAREAAAEFGALAARVAERLKAGRGPAPTAH